MIIKRVDSKHLIPINIFEKCLICGTTIKEIKKLYPSRKNGAYLLDKFERFLQDKHQTNIKKYCIEILKIDWPKCPASGGDVGYRSTGKGLLLSSCKYITKETNEKFKQACNRFSKERKGKNNPMYGRTPWNKGLSTEDPRIKKISERFKGKVLTESHKEKLRQARSKSNKRARHTTKHSKESKLKMAEATSKGWSEGRFNRVTSIHLKVRNFLEQPPFPRLPVRPPALPSAFTPKAIS